MREGGTLKGHSNGEWIKHKRVVESAAVLTVGAYRLIADIWLAQVQEYLLHRLGLLLGKRDECSIPS